MKPQPTAIQRFTNLLRESHRSAKPAGVVFYLPTFAVVTILLLPFLVMEPDAFDYSDHV